MKSAKIKNKANSVNLLSEADAKPENVKIRVTTYISEDILNWLKKEAEKKNIGYQTFLDHALRVQMEDRTKFTVFAEKLFSDKFLARRVGEAIDKMIAGEKIK